MTWRWLFRSVTCDQATPSASCPSPPSPAGSLAAGAGGPPISNFTAGLEASRAALRVRLGTPLILPEGFGCVVLVGCTSMMLVSWKSMKVAEARRDFKVPVPLTHSETSMTFNCIYRALQSTMELYPQYLFLLVMGGLEMPYFTSLGGLIWILGRYVYAKGYYSGDPRKRANGSFYIVGHAMLFVGALRFASKRLFL